MSPVLTHIKPKDDFMPPLSDPHRQLWRAALTDEALLSFDEAADALPGTPYDNRAWVSAHVRPFGLVAGKDVYRWGDLRSQVTGKGHAPKAAPPINRWKQVAAILGISDVTLSRRRTAASHGGPCFFANEAEVHAWWRSIIKPLPPEPPSRPIGRKKKSQSSPRRGGPVDWDAMRRKLKRSK